MGIVRGGCESGTKVTSGASVAAKKVSMLKFDLRRGQQCKRHETRERKVMDTYRVIAAESEAKTVYLVQVEGVCVQDADIHFPLFEVGGGDEVDSRWKRLLDLGFGDQDLRTNIGEK